MLVSHQKKFIFTKTSKTARTSVESYYEKYCMPEGEWEQSHSREKYISETGIIGYRGILPKGHTYVNHMPAVTIKELIGDEIWDSYFKFTVVRNPFSKMVSGWYHFHKPKLSIAKKLKYSLIRPGWTSRFFSDKGDIYSFRSWVKNGGILNDKDKYMIGGEVCVDFFVKQETLLEDLRVVNKKLGIKSDEIVLPRFKSGFKSDEFAIQEFYDKQTEKIVRDFYSWEFERFGYEMP